MTVLLLKACGVFYAVLCVFSIVTGLMYAGGKREINPLELSDRFMEKYQDPEKRRRFTLRMGWVTFLVGIVQGLTAFSIFRGGVFCNAQTANVVLMALAFGHGQWQKGFYYLIPITAYFAGAAVSEALPSGIRHRNFLRWDTCLIAFEILILFLLGFVPLTWPAQIVQVTINFLCSMQYNTSRQAEGIPMATTFVTNHIRQTGIWTVTAIRKKDPAARSRAWKHFRMVAVFFLGGLLLTLCCSALQEKAIWVAVLPLAVTLVLLLRADLILERQLFDLKPHGH